MQIMKRLNKAAYVDLEIIMTVVGFTKFIFHCAWSKP